MIESARTGSSEDGPSSGHDSDGESRRLWPTSRAAAGDAEPPLRIRLDDTRYGVLREVVNFCYTDSVACLTAPPEVANPL